MCLRHLLDHHVLVDKTSTEPILQERVVNSIIYSRIDESFGIYVGQVQSLTPPPRHGSLSIVYLFLL